MICVACLKTLDEYKDCVGECTLYKSTDYHTLCEECFLDEDGPLFDLAGTNDIPGLIAIYDQAYARRRNNSDVRGRPTQLYKPGMERFP